MLSPLRSSILGIEAGCGLGPLLLRKKRAGSLIPWRLYIIKNGPSRTRTCDPLIMSQLL
jgi:hypothetical protein